MPVMILFRERPLLTMVTLLLLAGCRTTDSHSNTSDRVSNIRDSAPRQVTIVVVEDCPGAAPTAALVRTVAARMGFHDLNVQMIVVRTPMEAIDHKMLGSPTVLVDGTDIEPRARTRIDFAIACRTYGGRPTPPASMVEKAIRDASHP